MERFILLEYWENLQNGECQAVTNFALSKSIVSNTKLSICVHSKKYCDQFLKKCFSNESLAKKLINGQKITVQGVTVTLESLITLQKQFTMESVVYLALYPSRKMMTLLEKSNTKAEAIIVFSEKQHSEHLSEWINKFNPMKLECHTKDEQNS